jgi:antitoxin component of MazEF toxin-antitoxin module
MKTLPVQVTEEGVLIPKEYLQQADEFEVVVQNGDILVRPKSQPKDDRPVKKSWLHDLVGIAESKDPTASERVEEILMTEVTRRSGWTTKPSIDEVE